MFSMIPWKRRESSSALARRDDSPFSRIREEFDNLFDRFFAPWPMLDVGWGLDFEDTGKELVYRLEAPGFEAGEFDIQARDGLLTIRAEHKREGNGTAERWLERSLTLPQGIDRDQITAHYRNGILELKLPRSPEAQAKKIAVQA